METPREWAKRFTGTKTTDGTASLSPESKAAVQPASDAEFPSEPFQCPACGQLLAPNCRVCVACKQPINVAEIRTSPVAPPAAYATARGPRPQQVPYPWRVFFAVLAFALLLGLIYSEAIAFGLLKEIQAEVALRAAPIFVGIWVFFDARRRNISRPLRWAVGTMLLLILVFPWYLARRKRPDATVPFVEADVGPVTRFLLIALLFFVLGSLIVYIIQTPPWKTSPTAPTKIHHDGGASPSRVA